MYRYAYDAAKFAGRHDSINDDTVVAPNGSLADLT